MCTVTFWPGAGTYLLGLNHDESLDREPGLPPQRFHYGETDLLAPSELAGGFWVSVNDTGAAFALLKWDAMPHRPRRNVSRSVVVRALAACCQPGEADDRLRATGLSRINPFRLIGVFVDFKSVVEWNWDGKRLGRLDHRWEPRFWSTAAQQEAEALALRTAVWQRARSSASAGTSRWLRALHAAHEPARGPISLCQHGRESETVSYTEITVARTRVKLEYFPAALCEGPGGVGDTLKRKSGLRRRS